MLRNVLRSASVAVPIATLSVARFSLAISIFFLASSRSLLAVSVATLASPSPLNPRYVVTPRMTDARTKKTRATMRGVFDSAPFSERESERERAISGDLGARTGRRCGQTTR